MIIISIIIISSIISVTIITSEQEVGRAAVGRDA